MHISQRRIALLALFLAIPSVIALKQYGYVGFFPAALANAASTQVFCDLIVSLSLVSVWMIRDARRRGIAVAPYLWCTLLFGSFGPLLYLLRDEPQPANSTSV